MTVKQPKLGELRIIEADLKADGQAGYGKCSYGHKLECFYGGQWNYICPAPNSEEARQQVEAFQAAIDGVIDDTPFYVE